MPRLREQRYKHADGSSHLNCYNLSITRKCAEEAGFTPADMLEVTAKDGQIIVRKRSVNNG